MLHAYSARPPLLTSLQPLPPTPVSSRFLLPVAAHLTLRRPTGFRFALRRSAVTPQLGREECVCAATKIRPFYTEASPQTYPFPPQEAAGCERTVITFSALIAACERDGAWELALQLFAQMLREGCAPNVITYNSLITALAAGGQWERAADAFGQLQRSGCEPDVVTYTALINAYEKGGQWRRAVQVMALRA